MRKLVKTENSAYVKMLALYFICLPLGAIKIGVIGSALKLVALLPTIVFIFRQGRVIKLTRPVLFQIGLAFLALVSYVWSPFKIVWWRAASGQMLFIILLLPTANMVLYPDEWDYLKKSLVWASRLTLLLVFLFSSFNADGRLYFTGVIAEDPNYLCTYFLFGAAFAVERILSPGKVIGRLLAGAEILLYLFVDFQTGSRSGMVATAVVCAIYFLFYNRKEKYNIFRRILIVLLMAIAVIIAFKYLPEDVASRFSSESESLSTGSNRYNLWGEAVYTFFHSDPLYSLFGWGAGNAAYANSEIVFDYEIPHNAFLHILLEEGLVGFLFYFGLIYSALKKAITSKHIWKISIMIAMIVFSFSASIIAFKPYWNIMLICLFTVYENNPNYEVQNYENYAGNSPS
ncbi:MAG: O-antigen ligase family protein [Oscillospiraceae bacterium]|nr:O-antigen ligase family protein [Candidatus Equicaccousia limihippi]